MRYLSRASVLPTVDGRQPAPSLERLSTSKGAKRCTALDRVNNDFSHLKKDPPKKLNISLGAQYI